MRLSGGERRREGYGDEGDGILLELATWAGGWAVV